MQDRPDSGELLDAIADFLRGQANEATDRWHRFQFQVAANSLTILSREFKQEDSHLENDWRHLDNLLGEEVRPAQRPDLVAALRRRHEELCSGIRAGEFDAPEREAELLEFLWQTVTDKVAITNPKELR
ncbi:hypothetical protein AYO38_00090 [bacterium SCGC AG-212-C10]|nr:hypothetical protein AYO38_00090 [bacterium SCGC AG-212-C10]